MIPIENIHLLIDTIARKNHSPSFSPEEKDSAINAASLDLFIELVSIHKESGVMPDLLDNFKSDSTVPLSGGTGSMSVADSEVISISSIVSSNEYPAKIATNDEQWLSRRFSDIVGEDDSDPKAPLGIHIQTRNISSESIGLTLPSDYIQPISIEGVSGGRSYKGLIVDPEKFYSHDMGDLLTESGEVSQYNLKRSSLSVTVGDNGVKDLPEGFVAAKAIYFKDSNNNLSEGLILDYDDFIDRVESRIQPPTTDTPIATIYDDSIDIYPRPTGTDTYNFELAHYAHPVIKRPIAKIEGDKIFARPIDTYVTFKYYAYPIEKRALVRYSSSDTDIDFEVNPSTVSSIRVYYLKKPVVGVYGYTQSNGIVTFDNDESTDLDWDSKAQSRIASKALTYLGISVSDEFLTQTDRITSGS